MMKKLLYTLALTAVFFLQDSLPLRADVTYEKKISADRIVNNFGDIITMTGPVSCDFTFTNLDTTPASLYSISSSCGCTIPTWSKKPFKNGESTKITVTFKNEDALGDFDKTLTCYFTNLAKPVILHIKGRVFPKKVSLEERFPVKIGENLAVIKIPLQLPNLEQGDAKETEFDIANLSNKPQEVVFSAVNPQIEITIAPNPVPARTVAKMKVRVQSSRDHWGLVEYRAAVRGGGSLVFSGFTKDNFSGMSENEKAKSGKPYFETSTVFLGTFDNKVAQNKGATPKTEGSFVFKNIGYSPLVIYKADVLESYVKVLSYPGEVKPGEQGKLHVEVNPTDLPEGEYTSTVVLTTSSPSRPIVNLFVSFTVK